MSRIEKILDSVCAYLRKHGLEYVLIGGIVVVAYGINRSTTDIDMIIRMRRDQIANFVKFLKGNGFLIDYEDMITALKERSHVSAHDETSIYRLDIKGVYSEMDRRTIERGVTVDFHGIRARIETPEDLIAAKLVFGSEQDVRDAEGVYVRQKKRLDMTYLEDACKRNGVLRELRAMVKRLEKMSEG